MKRMGLYEERIQGKAAEEILRTAGGSWWRMAGPGWRCVSGCRSIRGTENLIRTQNACTIKLAESVETLVASLNRASSDSGKLGTKVMLLTGALVVVGFGQTIATAWPFLAYW